jgi:uncharacterized metal-binding protein
MKHNFPLIYSCSGCSNSAQLTNDLAVKIDRDKFAEMSCIAGIGGKVKTILHKAKSGRPIIALDGCVLACCLESFKQNDICPDLHFRLSDFAIKKEFHNDYNKSDFEKIYEILKNKIQHEFIID